jgi:preprotein translocase subunit YajC
MWIEGIAWAQQSSAAGEPQNLIDQLLYSPALPLIIVVGVLYFLMIRPQSKKAADHSKMLNALKRNDEVVTNGGLVGRIAELGDKILVLEIAQGVRVRVERSQIAGLSSYGKTAAKKEKGE